MAKNEKNKGYMNIFLKLIEKYLSWVIAIGGLICSIVGLFNTDAFSSRVVYLIVIIDTLILIGIGCYIAISYYINLSKKGEYERDIECYARRVDALKEKLQINKKTIETININSEYIISSLCNFLNRFFSMTDKALDEIESIKTEEKEMREHNYTNSEINKKIALLTKEKNDYIWHSVIDDYNRFLGNITVKAKETIEAYLSSKGIKTNVALAIKLLITPTEMRQINKVQNQPIVYTAFRDSKTWREKKRNEIAKNKYTINKNSDFIHCLNRDYFIFNNKNSDSEDYTNENKNFDDYYNCGVTSLISSNKHDDRIVYGFLACDVLNENSELEDIMDMNVANILKGISHVIATYFDNIDNNWVFFEFSDEYVSFWEHLKIYYFKK